MSEKTSKDAFNRSVTNPDGSPLRDKDNAQPVLKPTFSAKPAPNLAPAGAMGIKTRERYDPEPEKPRIEFNRPSLEPDLSPDPTEGRSGIAYSESETTNWIEGRIVTMPGYTFHAKVFSEPSAHGIDDGKISKLQVKKDDVEVINYDHGWDVRPETPEQKEALHRIRNGLDDTPEKDFKGFDQGRDKLQGFER